MKADVLIAELQAELPSIGVTGGIDALSVYRWIKSELRRFGKDVTTLYEDVLEVRGGTARLPDHFYSLKTAYRCEPLGYECTPEAKAVLQETLFWKERVEYGTKWNSCDHCCREEFEKTIVENVYINEASVRFHYRNPVMLRPDRPMEKNPCVAECRNRIAADRPDGIMINGFTLYANFDGDIYMRYWGVVQDERGVPEIPDTDLNLVQRYMENFIKMKIFERQMNNGEDSSAAKKFELYYNICRNDFPAAMTDAKMTRYDWSLYPALKRKMRSYTLAFENTGFKI
jgi:hypothetical protein